MSELPPPPRPSRRPLAEICASSILPCDNPIGYPTEARELGSACHQSLAEHLMGENPNLLAISIRWNVNLDELTELHERGARILEELREYLPEELAAEVKINGPLGGGTMDILGLPKAREGGVAVIIDWKSGWVDREAKPQLEAYGHALLTEISALASAKLIQINIRTGLYRVWDFGKAELDAFEARDLAMRESAGSEYSPGPHCSLCPRRLDCGAYERWGLQSFAMVLGADIPALAPHQVVALHPRVLAVEKACSELRKVIRSVVETHGPQPLPNGKELRITEERREAINPRKGWPTLSGLLTADELAGCVEIGKGAVEALIKQKAPPRKGAANWRAVIKALRDADALEARTITKLSERKPK